MGANDFIKKERDRVGIYSFVLETIGAVVILGAVLGAVKALFGG